MTKQEKIGILEEKINNIEATIRWQKELIDWLMSKHKDYIIQPYQPNIVQPMSPLIDPNGTAKPIWDSGSKIVCTNASEEATWDCGVLLGNEGYKIVSTSSLEDIT